MKAFKILGLLLIVTLLSSCLLPHRLTEVESEQRNVEVWSSENSSIKVSGTLQFSRGRPTTWYNGAGWVKFRIRVKSPDRKLQLGSEKVELHWHCSNTDLIIPFPIDENTLSNSRLLDSKRNRFTVTGILTKEIRESMWDATGLGEFELELPELLYKNDTLTLPPLRFYRKGRGFFLIHS